MKTSTLLNATRASAEFILNNRSFTGYVTSVYAGLLGIFIFNRLWSHVLTDYEFGILLSELRHVSITALVLFLPMRFYVLKNQGAGIVLIPLLLSLLFYCANYVGVKPTPVIVTTLLLMLCSSGAAYMTENYVLKDDVNRLSISSVFKSTAPILVSICFLAIFEPRGTLAPLIILLITTFIFFVYLYHWREKKTSEPSFSNVPGTYEQAKIENLKSTTSDSIFIVCSALITYASNFFILEIILRGHHVVQTLVLFQTYMMIAQFGGSVNNIVLRSKINGQSRSIFKNGTLIYGIMIGVLSIGIWTFQGFFFEYVWGVDQPPDSLMSYLLLAFGVFFGYRYFFNYFINALVSQGRSAKLFYLVTLEFLAIFVPYLFGWTVSWTFFSVALVFAILAGFCMVIYVSQRFGS